MFVVNCAALLNVFLFFFNDTATTEIYTLSLHDALPIYFTKLPRCAECFKNPAAKPPLTDRIWRYAQIFPWKDPFRRLLKDRKSTRLNSSHGYISYAVFCLKKKKK